MVESTHPRTKSIWRKVTGGSVGLPNQARFRRSRWEHYPTRMVTQKARGDTGVGLDYHKTSSFAGWSHGHFMLSPGCEPPWRSFVTNYHPTWLKCSIFRSTYPPQTIPVKGIGYDDQNHIEIGSFEMNNSIGCKGVVKSVLSPHTAHTVSNLVIGQQNILDMNTSPLLRTYFSTRCSQHSIDSFI